MDGLSRVICVAVVERKEGQVKPTAAFYHGKRNGCAMVMVVTMVTMILSMMAFVATLTYVGQIT